MIFSTDLVPNFRIHFLLATCTLLIAVEKASREQPPWPRFEPANQMACINYLLPNHHPRESLTKEQWVVCVPGNTTASTRGLGPPKPESDLMYSK
ncbi:hypothetical protein MC885_016250 [Smutsia gigantea]|nr:hypothetical protein MC885_016250 [Smutsia gigantea]